MAEKVYLKAGQSFATTIIVTLVEQADESSLTAAPLATSFSWDSAGDLAGYQNPDDVHDRKVGELVIMLPEECFVQNIYQDALDGRFYYNKPPINQQEEQEDEQG